MNDHEKELLRRAKVYMQTMAAGKDPVTGAEAPENDVIRQEKVCRCLSYISGVLEQLLERENLPATRHYIANKPDFFLTAEQRRRLIPYDMPVFVRDLGEVINQFSYENGCSRFQTKWITAYFCANGMFETDNGSKRATEAGKDIGIISVRKFVQSTGQYAWVNSYNTAAQVYIFDHLSEIMQSAAEAENNKS